MSIIEQNLQYVLYQIRLAAHDCGRDPQQINLVAVSKSQTIEAIESAIAAGQRAFGENYVKEGVKKIVWFRERLQSVTLIWHFIGPLQSNKSALVAEHFDWCHTLDRPKIARKLNNQRPAGRLPLNVLIQINISCELTKTGIAFDQMLTLASLISRCPRLKLRGLMAIPALEEDFQRKLAVFKHMFELYKTLQRFHYGIDTLSLGMTNCMLPAITAGSTLVRIGTAIFGGRVT
ncbi:YggS family pyridoxal phosphate-dependent enzyme [Candidatus Steffania adelgidicola]|uniref:YggS family pyridoxal phosphate-dependent enzyme n=1 Tax=Candidatus Steffania adelgidicola TaxID=1076626 RepID=UPI001D00E7EA|nr:YggS family pyridoxal phosphate-dependent enzyme [Candidatus Steffania adelgidicola]